MAVIWLRRAYPESYRRGVPERYARLLWPMENPELIRQAAQSNGLDPSFVAAVIHQESRFQHDARSSAGARGLMQIMPGTGREIARRLGERTLERAIRRNPTVLYDPEVNLRFGTYFMARLIAQYDGRKELALAGYNAGPHRVDKWLKHYPRADMDEFVESIPFRETRIYVKNIMLGHFFYSHLYGNGVPG